jgi:hypothetical protein
VQARPMQNSLPSPRKKPHTNLHHLMSSICLVLVFGASLNHSLVSCVIASTKSERDNHSSRVTEILHWPAVTTIAKQQRHKRNHLSRNGTEREFLTRIENFTHRTCQSEMRLPDYRGSLFFRSVVWGNHSYSIELASANNLT